MQSQTIFSKIIEGALPAHIVFHDADTCAFLDINPVNQGHVLVVPTEPYRDLFSMPEPVFLAVMRTVHHIAPAVIHAVGADGLTLGMNNGEAAGQEVFHAHVHLIPRHYRDGHTHWKGAAYPEGKAEEVARAIRDALTSQTPQ